MVIYDANNGNIKSRKDTRDKFEEMGVHVIFLGQWSFQSSPPTIICGSEAMLSILHFPESQCDKEDIITANIRSVKLSSPDVRCLSPYLSRYA